jgi:hypothetical protein
VERPSPATGKWGTKSPASPFAEAGAGVQPQGSSEHRCFRADHVRFRRKGHTSAEQVGRLWGPDPPPQDFFYRAIALPWHPLS